MSSRPRRWFVYSLIGLLLFLFLAITLAALLLLRRGKLPRTGLITGSSMEPVLRGPRFTWTCQACSETQEFAFDTCKSHQPFLCRRCGKMDPSSAVDFESDENIADKIRPGDEVRYSTLRNMRSIRATEIATGSAQPNSLVRGDIVVFQETAGAKREVKRVVGFASEHIEISNGDIFVNEERWCKTLEQALRQSILLDAWQGAALSQNKRPQNRLSASWSLSHGDFDGVLSPLNSQSVNESDVSNGTDRKLVFASPTKDYLDNQLQVNAHDSHAIVPIRDFGFAFQVMATEAPWEIRCQLHSPACDPDISMEWNGSELKLHSGEEIVRTQAMYIKAQPLWFVIAMVDGHLIAGSQKEEWLRVKLPSNVEPSTTETLAINPPIEITPVSGNLSIDQLVVFRDIYYRGHGDSDSQTWEPTEQLIVLGDNVSASSDSRDRWPDGLPAKAIKGVVLQTESPMEVLLRQR